MAIDTELDDTTNVRWLAAAAIALACHTVWYGTGVLHGGFRNLDVSGIAYNARLLLDGGLPYVDSWEPKPPGSFFLFAVILAFGSMRAVWAVAILWGAATSLGVGLLAERLWGRRFLVPAVALHAGGALLPTQADINYSFWATMPFVLAAAMAFKPAAEVARPRQHWALVGAVAACAVLLKQSTIGLLAVLALAVYQRGGERHADRLRAAACGTLGAACVFFALFLPWVLAGQTRALVAGLGIAGGWWVDYAAAQVVPTGGLLVTLWRGTWSIVETMQIGSAAMLLGIAFRPRARTDAERAAYRAALAFLLAAFVGMAVTLRFYLHYLAQLWPAMVLVALHPAGSFVRVLDWAAGLGVRRSIACLLLATGGTLLRIDKVANRGERDSNNRVIAELCAAVEPQLAPGDPVLAWGWASWSVYDHCNRRAPGPIYKEMTIVTTPNTNTGWRGSDPMLLRPGPATDRFVADFLAKRPPLVLWSSSYVERGHEPLTDLPAITRVLDAEYRGVVLGQDYVAFLRSDLQDRVARLHPWLDQNVRLADVLATWEQAQALSADR